MSMTTTQNTFEGQWEEIVNGDETDGERSARIAAEENASMDYADHTPDWYRMVITARQELLDSGQYDF
jgi:hypothetical protein